MNWEEFKDKAEITCLICLFAISLVALTPGT